MTEMPKNPGSLKAFAESNGLNPNSYEARVHYADKITKYRVNLASALGISLEQLHAKDTTFLPKQIKISSKEGGNNE